jgi:predicted nucleic acid-binding protein
MRSGHRLITPAATAFRAKLTLYIFFHVIYISIKFPIARLQTKLSSNIQTHARVRFQGSHEREQIKEREKKRRDEKRRKIKRRYEKRGEKRLKDKKMGGRKGEKSEEIKKKQKNKFYKYYVFGHYLSSRLYLSKHNVSETGFCLRLQVKPTQLGPIDRASSYLRT